MKQIFNWNQYLKASEKAATEGIVMLKNENAVLPLDCKKSIALFGRMQFHYYKSGTGSGGLVNVHHVVSMEEAFTEENIAINQELKNVYKEWNQNHPIDKGEGWGGEAWSQEEMPLTDAIASMAAQNSETAICIIGRTAGEEQDNFERAGSYLLTDLEIQMLETVRRHFSKMVVLLNVGNLIDMQEIERISPDSILYIWQGGMVGCKGVANILSGKESPSGKLPDTIAKSLKDYPSYEYFGDQDRNIYAEDIYVGYRYFELVAPEKVLYPFGFGLSYSTFQLETLSAEWNDNQISVKVSVTNTGAVAGKEVVQVYAQAPQGRLGKPARVLCGFQKTKCLAPGESETVLIQFDYNAFASYDESQSAFILEQGDYQFFVGTDVRNSVSVLRHTLSEDLILHICRNAMAPVIHFDRMKPMAQDNKYSMTFEPVPTMQYDEAQRRLEGLPLEIPYTGSKGITLNDVKQNKASMEDFIAQLDKEDLCAMMRGEGMGSPKAVPGTAAVFGGITPKLSELGIPAACCDDGPSGLRLDGGQKVASLPNGTMLASTFNPDILTELFVFTGLEMRINKIDNLLGPGMNIHRHPLNGRNFEYFSEDPLLSGVMGTAILKGLRQSGVTGTIKHFCANNQETNRHYLESVVSERALREIYLRGFEIAVKSGETDAIMSTYGCVNGLWTNSNYDLCTEILRKEWGYRGIVMTDWWANTNNRGEAPVRNNYAAMVRAQNDVYMVCHDTTKEQSTLKTDLESGALTIAELQRNAMNLCRFLMNTPAMERICDCEPEIVCEDCPVDTEDDGVPIRFLEVGKNFVYHMEHLEAKPNTRHSFVLNLQHLGRYNIKMTGYAKDSGAVEVFLLGSHVNTYEFGSEPVSLTKEYHLFSNYTIVRMNFLGENPKPITFELEYLGVSDKSF